MVGPAVGALVVLLGLVHSAGALELRQAPGSPYAMSVGEPQAVALGDFNGDGLPDLAVGSWAHSPSNTVGASSVSVLVGQRAGGLLSAPGPIALGEGPVSVTAADFNGDGKSDLAAANDGKLSVFLSDAAGHFSAAPGSPIDAPRAFRIVAGDLNGDAKADLVALNSDDTLSVWLGDGNGSFAAASGSPIALGGGSPASVAIGDFNGDGRADLAVTDSARGTVTVLLGNGDGTLAPVAGSPFAAGATPDAIAVGDFNGDGRQDLATTAANGVPVFLGRGDGTFAPAAPAVTLGPVSAELAVGDFNDDGRPDLAASGDSSDPNGALRLLLGDGSGAFRASAVSPSGIEVQHVLAGGHLDGRTGLVVSRLGLGGDTLSVLLAPLRSDPPSASLVPHPRRVLPGSPVQLDASASTDPLDRAIVCCAI